jgi:hypothetical protein
MGVFSKSVRLKICKIGGGLEFKMKRLIGVKRGGLPDEDWAKLAKMRQSRFSLASARVLRTVGWRMPAW